MNIRQARSVTGEAAGLYELTPLENGRDGMARRQPHDLPAPAVKEWIRGDDEGVDPPLDKHYKS